MLQERIEFVGMLRKGAIECGSNLLTTPAPEKLLQRGPDELAARDAEIFGGGLGLLEERLRDRNGDFYTRSIT